MLPQQIDTLHLVGLAQARGKPAVVGGPNVTSSPEVFSHADFLVLGEAEGVINKFVEGWNAGERCGRYEAEKFTADVSKSPIPRFDLLNFKHYLYVGVQFSRGCPFNCEFCDIIELYGKVPRAKTNAQMLAELQTLYDLGYRGHVDFVDDNLIGNKKALKAFLPALRTWQEERGYPFEFSTEASMNLADDGQLLAMMKTANFFAIFMGIESPDAETLIATQKKQNTRRSLAESVHKIYGAGMFVIAGFIVGFDTEKGGMAAGMIDCIEASSIPACMVGLLTALPNTQLMRRLQAEKRLLPLVSEDGDQCLAGLNFVTLRARRDILEDYKTVLEAVYEPSAYFARVRGVGRALKRLDLPSKAHTKHNFQLLLQLMSHMTVQRPDLRQHFWKTFLDTARHNPGALESIVSLMLLYLHLGAFSQHVVRELDKQIAAIETEAQQQVIAASAAA
jgi:radical SAM superfamily enzyme YgiQ (UPF0313 family)